MAKYNIHRKLTPIKFGDKGKNAYFCSRVMIKSHQYISLTVQIKGDPNMAKTKDDFKMQRDAAHGISSSEPKVKEKRSMKYLDPKTDLTFKKIFYKHPDLLISLLTEIDTNTEQVPTELKENPEIQKALEELKVTGFTEEELRAYEKLLDNIRVERTLQQDSYEKGVEEGMEKGIEQGVEIGLTKGQNKEKFTIAQKMLSAKLPYSQIIAFTGLTEEQLKEILDEGFTI